MAAWDSADLLSRFNRTAGRPAADAITDATKYQIGAEAQQSVLAKIAGIAGRVLYGPPQQMTTSDGGYTFTYGLDGDGLPLFPLGKGGIFPSLNAIPDYPWTPGVDYLDEGTQIRMPNNMQWSGSLYWYGITPPAELSATNQPVIEPPAARILIVIEWVRIFAEDYDKNPGLVASMERRWDREFGPWMTQLRRHIRGGGRLGPLVTPTGIGGPWGGGWWG